MICPQCGYDTTNDKTRLQQLVEEVKEKRARMTSEEKQAQLDEFNKMMKETHKRSEEWRKKCKLNFRQIIKCKIRDIINIIKKDYNSHDYEDLH